MQVRITLDDSRGDSTFDVFFEASVWNLKITLHKTDQKIS